MFERFQPFLRFYGDHHVGIGHWRNCVSTLLEILLAEALTKVARKRGMFQPFLRFYEEYFAPSDVRRFVFQPFLRFYRSCGWLL